MPTAVRKGALDIVKLLTHPSVITIKSKDDKQETALQLGVRLGEEYTDFVGFLQEHDKSWKGSREEILKTVYPAVAGGHKNILRILTDQIDWNDYSGECLMRAVRENNKTCVNYLYGRNLTPPKDNDRQSALKVAKEKKRDFDIKGEKEKGKCAQQIINKLTPEEKAIKVESVSGKVKSKVKTPRGEYMELIKKIRGKSNKEIFDEIDEDVRQLARICKEIKDAERKKLLNTSPTYSPSEATGLSLTKHSHLVSDSKYASKYGDRQT